jgi:hypothetical protein
LFGAAVSDFKSYYRWKKCLHKVDDINLGRTFMILEIFSPALLTSESLLIAEADLRAYKAQA